MRKEFLKSGYPCKQNSCENYRKFAVNDKAGRTFFVSKGKNVIFDAIAAIYRCSMCKYFKGIDFYHEYNQG